MSIYDVEEGIDFYKELYGNNDTHNDTGNDTHDTADDDHNEVCMITNLPLTETHVSLLCGHSYNYDAIFNDAKQIRKNNHIDVRKIDCYEIQCPYCRVRQTTLLPFISTVKRDKVHGVNWIDTAKVFGSGHDFEYFPEKKCEWKCNEGNICGRANTIRDNSNGVVYCYPHFNHYYDTKYNLTTRGTRRRLQRTKLATASKMNGHNGHGENIIVSVSTVAPSQFCQAVIKSGKRAGLQCGYKAKINGCCLIHKPQ